MSEGSVCKARPDGCELAYHLSLLKIDSHLEQLEEASLAPVFTHHVFSHFPGSSASKPTGVISQYGLLAGITKANGLDFQGHEDRKAWDKDPRLFFNVSFPSSTFICGSQGSGKSHTLSCILEGSLIRSKAGRLSKPLTAVVFYYDTFISDSNGSPCEAAFLASNPDIKVRVLCAPTNLRTIQVTNVLEHCVVASADFCQGTYSRFKNIQVEALQIDQADLNTKRMLDLMAVGQDNGPLPLYMHTVQRILREMRVEQQNLGAGFDYAGFKSRILDSGLTPGQLEPLKQRLDTLESFMPPQQVFPNPGKKIKAKRWGSGWMPQPSQLTIVDLSCPCISSDTACSLFNICFGIFLEQTSEVGRIVALDEAHKYMDNSVEARSFTESLLSTVRQTTSWDTYCDLNTRADDIDLAPWSLLCHHCSSFLIARMAPCVEKNI
ncbi:hypothetical protein N7451_012584 [Penicillium sp. IBT 35674x]|nr:hypothetical protein N7451_012584 [Penicillium sp. IBT 35674x]